MSSRSILPVLVLFCWTTAPAHVGAQTRSSYRMIVEAPYTPFVMQMPGPGDLPRGVGTFYSRYGDYLKKKEEAALQKEDVRQKKLETHRKQLEHWEWAHNWKAGLSNRIKEVDRREQLVYAVNSAQLTEIANGKPLNDILEAMSSHSPSLVATLTAEPLDQEVIDAINTNFGSRGHLGILKGGKLAWPPALHNSAYARLRKQVDAAVAAIYARLVTSRNVEGSELKLLGLHVADLDSLRRDRLRKGQYDFDLGAESMMARRFIGQLESMLTVLYQEPETAYLYLCPVEGRNAAQIAAYLLQKGLQIAPPTVGKGGERHYKTLHREFVKLLKQLDPEAGVVKPAPPR